MYEAVKLQFLKSRSAEDFAAGLAFAIEREWLSNENIMIRLTKSGFDENSEAQIRAFTRGDDFFSLPGGVTVVRSDHYTLT
jgi:hypothetical protein